MFRKLFNFEISPFENYSLQKVLVSFIKLSFGYTFYWNIEPWMVLNLLERSLQRITYYKTILKKEGKKERHCKTNIFLTLFEI